MNADFADLFALFLFGEIDLFEAYLENMEGFLEEQYEELREEIRTGKRIVPPDEPPIYQVDLFANILRKSLFVSLYGFFESQLTAACRARKQARDDIQLSLSDITGRGITRAKVYLVKVLRVNFPFGTNPEWQEIQEYRILRNCIVHNEGVLEGMSSKDVAKLRKYIDRKQTLSLWWDDDIIILKKGFCEEALDTIRRFLRLLHPLLFSGDAQD